MLNRPNERINIQIMKKIEEINRLQHLEKKYEISFNYLSAYQIVKQLVIFGEVTGNNTKVSIIGVAYSSDGEILGSNKNGYYGGSRITEQIKFSDSCKLVPFRISIELPIGEVVSKIRVYPKVSDDVMMLNQSKTSDKSKAGNKLKTSDNVITFDEWDVDVWDV